MLSAFVLYRKLVFQVSGHLWLDLSRFLLFYVGTFVLNIALVPPLTLLLGWDKIVAQLAFTVFSAVASWFHHSRFSFRRKNEK
ncbi:GtrA family protein [Microbacterium oryzae]|uniref:GtrA family protein n=1 Tax=Microbacterium oryzae TaxID=743009 RepID=UPI0025AF62EC|nr:GtrA family protein [Microbacterium oryzae]MDN3311768.1 GtrA family protein [Microbacterium oryzae]